MQLRPFYFLTPLVFFFLNSCGGNVTIDTSIDPQSTDSTSQNDTLKNLHTNIKIKSVEFKASDDLLISAKLYESKVKSGTPIVLCHQARFNKFEYAGIAEPLAERGYHCLAIDQRSGGPIADQLNETNIRAKQKGLGTDYLDAQKDITAAVNYMADKYNQPVILWGSSYSSTLVLYEAVNNKNVAAVVSFSPGNYFLDSLGSLIPLIADLEKPIFLTSAKFEKPQVDEILNGKELNDKQVYFVPEGNGHHGSRALWPHQEGGDEYWDAINAWLKKL